MKGNSLLNFCIKLIIFGLLGVVIIRFFIIPFVPDIDTDQKYVYAINKIDTEKKDTTYSIAFFGNSYSFTAYDPTIIKNKLGLNAIHLNSGAQRLETSLIVANDILGKHSLKYVFLEVSGATLLTPPKNDTKMWYFQTMALQEIPFSYEKFNEVNNYFPIEENTKYYLSALSKNIGRFIRINHIESYKSPANDTSFLSNSKKMYFSYNGFLANNQNPVTEEMFKKEFYRKAYAGKEVLWTDRKISLLRAFIKKAQKQGTQVILILSLKLYPTIYNDSAIQGFLKEFDNVHFLNFNAQRNQYSLNAESFYNSSHLNYRGSYQVTNRLVDSLSKWYKLPIKNNKELDFKVFKFSDYFYSLDGSQDKFVKFEFDSIPEILKDHKLIVSLYPKDPNLLSAKTKKSNYDSDNFSIDLSKDVIDVGTSKVFIKKMDTKITEQSLKKLIVYFYKPNDTLKLPTYNLNSFN